MRFSGHLKLMPGKRLVDLHPWNLVDVKARNIGDFFRWHNFDERKK